MIEITIPALYPALVWAVVFGIVIVYGVIQYIISAFS